MKDWCHTWTSIRKKKKLLTCGRVMSRVNESCHTYERVMSHIWMSHVTRANESCHAYEWVMTDMQYDPFSRVMDPIYLYIYIYIYMYIQICIYVYKLSRVHVTWHIFHVRYAWVMTHTYLVSWPHKCHMRWLFDMWTSFVTYEWVTSDMCESCMTTSHESLTLYICIYIYVSIYIWIYLYIYMLFRVLLTWHILVSCETTISYATCFIKKDTQIYMYMCMFVYIDIHMYIHTCISMCVFVYRYTYVCMCVYIHMYMCAYIYICLHV